MKDASSPRRWATHAVLRAALFVVAGGPLAACGDDARSEDDLARHARQMRDVTRMLDAMEAGDATMVAALAAPPTPDVAAHAIAPARSRVARPPSGTGRAAVLAAGVGAASLCALLLWRRRRRRATRPPASPAPSLVPLFAAAEAPRVEAAEDTATPAPTSRDLPPVAWIYRQSDYEAPGLNLAPDPVDLLVPYAIARRAAPASRDGGCHDPRAALAALAGTDGPFLVGDARFPRLRGGGDAALHAWQAWATGHADHEGETGRLARWLRPAIDAALAHDLPPREALRRLDEIDAHADHAMADADDEERAQAAALRIELRLARIAALTGATRLFALRELVARLDRNAGRDGAALLDARIGILVAWASWSHGAVALARLDDADALCDRLAETDAASAARVGHRRGEIGVGRARLRRGADALPDLDRAQASLDDAYRLGADPATALLVARTALDRARLLDPDAAAEACSHALVHAFLAEQHPAWRAEALACRVAIKAMHDTLPVATPAPAPTAAFPPQRTHEPS